MRKSIFIILLVGFLLGVGFNPSIAYSQDNTGALPDTENGGENPNYFMNGVVFIIGLVLLWFLFHKLLYPLLLKYYHPSYCKNLFWSLLGLYGLAWITVATYVLFDIGFQIHFMKWVFVFIGVIWIIWFVIIMLKKDNAYS